jgi:hypothetical protein
MRRARNQEQTQSLVTILATMQLNEVQPNVPMDAARFAKPAPAVVAKAVAR